jgi:hypothetical protein
VVLAVVWERVWTFDALGFLVEPTAAGLSSVAFFVCSATGGGTGFLRCGNTAGGRGFFLADSVAFDLTALGLVAVDGVVLGPEELFVRVFVASEVFCCAAALIGFFTDDAAFVACPSCLAGVAAFVVVVELVDDLLGVVLAADEVDFVVPAAFDADAVGLIGDGLDFFIPAGFDGVALDIFDDTVLVDTFDADSLAGGSLSTRSIFCMSAGDGATEIQSYMRANEPLLMRIFEPITLRLLRSR